MIEIIASANNLYSVNLEPVLAIPIVYSISFTLSLLLREFVNGWLRYALWSVFIASFSALWYIMMLDQTLVAVILVLVIVAGGSVGLWRFVGRLYKDFRKLA